MASKTGQAMVGHLADGRCSAGFTDPTSFTHIEAFASERDARRWIVTEAEHHGVAEQDITWVTSESDADRN